MAIYEEIMNPEIESDILGAFLAAYNFHYSMEKYCGIQDVNHDVVNFLAEGKFTLHHLLNNFIKKFFTVTGALNNIGEIYFTTDFPAPSDTTSYFNIYETIGSNIGGVANTILGFTQWRNTALEMYYPLLYILWTILLL